MGLYSLSATTMLMNYGIEILLIVTALTSVIKHAKKGFVRCLFGLISTVVALAVAILLAKTVVNITDGVFGLEENIFEKFYESLSEMEGFDVDVSFLSIEEALEAQDVPEEFANVILKIVGDSDKPLPAGTTLATLVGEAFASLAATLVAGLIVFIIVLIIMSFFRKALTGWAENISFINSANGFLGGIYGFLKTFIGVCFVLAMLSLVPDDSVAIALSDTMFLGKLYEHNPLVAILGKII